MNCAELGNLTLHARTAYAVMCFERYTAFVYSDQNFKPAAEIMWHLVDGSIPAAEAAARFREIIPENLFAYQTHAAYQAAGHRALTQEQFRILTRILNPNDWNLNRMMQHIYQIMTEYDAADHVTPGAPETLPYLDEIRSILTVRRIELPDLRLLQQYACTDQFAAQDFDWRGGPIDPSPLSQLGITGTADCPPASDALPEDPVTHNADAETNISQFATAGYENAERRCAFEKNSSDDGISFFGTPEKPAAEANGCRWEYFENLNGCTVTHCVNSSYMKEITIPSELNGKPVIAVDDNAFSSSAEYGCMFIETLIMPDTIRQIGDGFFKGCTGLRHITLPAELESIGNDAFRGASKLESLAVGDRCRVIGDFFCADAVLLRSVTIGTGIECIGQYTFYNTPAMTDFRCDGMIRELGYGSFWVNKWADKQIFHPMAEMLRFCKDNALLYRYVKRTPPPRLFFDESIKYVYDFAFGGDAWNSGHGITDIYLPGAEKIGVQAFRKVPNATVHLSASRMQAAYGQDYRYALSALCEPARVVFDQA